ncbi:ATPase synthesis protein 25, mitochondrial [Paecilomyces lecythidis]|uniref:ATPase synthesis protein 25 n=1 Tax=Paecilomyces lecythidis TaxID=3004212 RepID=A0ABR3XK01_9EURO
MSRVLLKGPLCYACRGNVVQSFLAGSGVSITRTISPARALYHGRMLSSAARLRSEHTGSNNADISASTDSPGAKETTTGANPDVHIPWYLQVETPSTESHPLAHKQQLPPLPENSPPVLQDILQHTSVDIGLDDLALFDLRGLDPPPALGGNVIMIIGTARSVKHLNVSADRLCRWLRSTYKLRPYADGLLGRNELKIKLRRKARRARIASSSGATLEQKDDGITTGWICVNAGIVEDSKSVRESRERDESFEGFGKIAGGTRIVVQMFTEEKRAEINLEGLWSAALEKAKGRHQDIAIDAPELTSEEVRAFPGIFDQSSSDRGIPPISRTSATIPLGRRSIHTSSSNPSNGLPTRNTDVSSEGVRLGSTSALPANQFSLQSMIDIESLFQSLSGLSDEMLRCEFGCGPDDRDSTLFLRLFYSRLDGFPPEQMIVAQLRLMCMAISVQHPSYHKNHLWETFQEYTSYGYPVSDKLGFDVVSALLTPSSVDGDAGYSQVLLSESDKELALRVLDYLSLQGTDVLNMHVFNILYEAASHSIPSSDDESPSKHAVDGEAVTPVEDPSRLKYVNFARVSKIIEALDLDIDPVQARVLLVLQFRNGDFDGFWKLWHKLPLHGIRRSLADYELLFGLHAELGDVRRARDCILSWVPMMEREEPQIPLTRKLAELILTCLRVIDPSIEDKALESSAAALPMLWNRCLAALEKGPATST